MIRIKDFMNQYNVSRSTIYNWIEQGLKFYKVNKIVMFETVDIDNFIKNRNK
jgi:predicted DNA-binding transcriptional regulator AlpA